MSGRKGKNDGLFSSFLQEISRINRESDEDFGQRHEALKRLQEPKNFSDKICSLEAQKDLSHLLV